MNSLNGKPYKQDHFFNMENSITEDLKSGKPVTIVFLGDSTTEQNGYTDGEPGHVKVLAEKLWPLFGEGLRLLNAGVSGDTAGDMLERIQRDVLDANPDYVIISSGINDSLQPEHVENFSTNMEEMIRLIRERSDARIVLRTTSPILGDNRIIKDRLNPVLKDLSKTKGLGFIDTFTIFENDFCDDPRYMTDVFHPNGKGQKVIADTILYGLFS